MIGRGGGGASSSVQPAAEEGLGPGGGEGVVDEEGESGDFGGAFLRTARFDVVVEEEEGEGEGEGEEDARGNADEGISRGRS